MSKINSKTSVFQLAWPIFIETLLFMLMGNVDTFMLSQYSDSSVAAVGNANQMLGSMMMLFNIATAATAVLVSQYLGAKQYQMLNKIYSLAVWVNVLFALTLSVLFMVFKTNLFTLMQIPSELWADTTLYADMRMWSMPVTAAYMVLSTIHKNHGHTRLMMILAVCLNIFNIIGNYAFLYGPFGIPILGVQGVALSTVISQCIGTAVLIYTMTTVVKGSVSLRNLLPFPKQLARKFFAIGLPSAAEPISWQFSQLFIFAFINTLGTASITARMYANMILMFTYMFALAIAQATQIMTGYLIGAGKEDQADTMVWDSMKKAWLVTLAMSVTFIIFRIQLLSIFTTNSMIIALGATIILVDLFLEWGRVANITLISSLRAAGDVNFPILVGIFSMWGLSTFGAYVLGIHFELGLVGIWLAMTSDEVIRGIIMVWRWRSGKWRNRSVVEREAS